MISRNRTCFSIGSDINDIKRRTCALAEISSVLSKKVTKNVRARAVVSLEIVWSA
jgi:hypothetical protein